MSAASSGARIPEREYANWHGAVMITGVSQSITGIQWAIAFGPVWETCGEKNNFEIDQQQWPEYVGIRKVLDRTDQNLLSVLHRQYEDPEKGMQEVAEVRLSPIPLLPPSAAS